MNAADYHVIERLRDGRDIEIRALKPEDRKGWLEYMGRMSDETRFRRFFTAKRDFSEKEIDFHVNVDFVHHVALVAVLGEGEGAIGVGGARYVSQTPGRATVAFLVDDDHQGLGIGKRLMRNLVALARAAGIEELDAEVLPENQPMLKVFAQCGLPMKTRRADGLLYITLTL